MKQVEMIRLSFAVVMSLITVARLSATERDMTPVAYFMDPPPAEVATPNYLPNDAQDVTVAKVRFDQGAGGVFWLGGRHCERCTDDIFFARLKIVEVLTGSAQTGQVLVVYLGKRSEHREFIALPLRLIKRVGSTPS